MSASERVDVAIVGGGIIGMSIARQAALAGLRVTLVERAQIGGGASHVAAGMLAPVAEAEHGEAARHLLALGLRSAAMWPAFAAALEEESGLATGFARTGTLLLARDDDEARELERQRRLHASLGLEAQRLRGSEARALEPALAPSVRLALAVAGDHAVDPRLVLSALRRACERLGVRLRERVGTASVELRDERVVGARVGEELVQADAVVVAAGAWSEAVAGAPAEERPPVRPVKGQIMRLRDPSGPGLVGRVLRFQGGYLVPRHDGRYVLGATVEETGLDLDATAGGVYELLRHARELVPGVHELEIEELGAGARPGTPDNAPVIGAGATQGLLWATGHHRNGVLLAPVTAEAAVAMIQGEIDEQLRPFSPRRFARVAVP